MSSICKGINKSTNKPCTRKVKEGIYCWQHKGQFIVKPEKKKFKTRIQHQIDNIKVDILDAKKQEDTYNDLLLNETDPDKIYEYATGLMSEQKRIEDLTKHIYNLKLKHQDAYDRKKVPAYKKKSIIPNYIIEEDKPEHIKKTSEYELRKFQSRQKKFQYLQSKKKSLTTKDMNNREKYFKDED